MIFPTVFVAGHMAVFSSLETEDLQIEEYPSGQGPKNIFNVLTLN